MKRPDTSEYQSYYQPYIRMVPEGDILEILDNQIRETRDLLGGLTEAAAEFRYGPDKWSLKEVLVHLIDSERTFGYRALCFARRDPAPLPSFDPDPWVENARAADRSLASLLDEYESVRRSHIQLFGGFDEEMSKRRGLASGVEFSVRTFPYLIAGHEVHHRKIIQEKYLPGARS